MKENTILKNLLKSKNKDDHKFGVALLTEMINNIINDLELKATVKDGYLYCKGESYNIISVYRCSGYDDYKLKFKLIELIDEYYYVPKNFENDLTGRSVYL